MSSNWVKLNVGGELFHTTLTTLLSCPDSLLGKMFEPDSGFEPAYNKDGVYFLDANPKYFAVILDWLRYKKIMVNSDINVSNVAEVADYFGLEQLVKEIREIGAVLITSTEQKSFEYLENFGGCLGLYLKQEDNTYRQAGGERYLYQASGGVWYVSDTLTKKDGSLRNSTSTESNILPRTDWQYKDDEDDGWKNANLKITEMKNFTFCNALTFSSPKFSKKEFLGKFSRISQDWLNGWPVYKNEEGKYLGVTSYGYWCVDVKIEENNADIYVDAISRKQVSSCPAQTGTWQYWEESQNWKPVDVETIEIECDVHN